jgi:hypothetical protein
VTEYSLMQFARLTPTPATVSERQVVEHEQLSRLKDNVDLNVLDIQAVPLEEREFLTEGVELHSAEKIGLSLYTREKRGTRCCRVDDAGKAPFRIAQAVIPRPMGPAVSGKSRNQLGALWPVTLSEQWSERYQPGDRSDVGVARSDVESRIASDILRSLRVERQPEVEVKRLKITAHGTIRRGEVEVADNRERSATVHGESETD